MVEYSTEGLDAVFGALADPTRREILDRLSDGPARVTDLAEPFPMSLNAVSKHVRVLERAGLVRREVRGREHHCLLNADPMSAAAEWVQRYERFWRERLDSLEAWLIRKKRTRT